MSVLATDLDLTINDSTTETNLYWQVSNGTNPEDMYLSIYESTKEDVEEEAMERLADQGGNFTQDEISEALNGNYSESFSEKCEGLFQSPTSQSFYTCISALKDNYNYEKELVILETKLKGKAEASEIWSDGDLSNSFFDLIVDFNIIEVILFGENTYTYPFSGNYSFDDSDDEDTEDDNAVTNEISIVNTSDNTQTENSTDENKNGEEDEEENKTKQNINYCQDPDEIIFETPVWSVDSEHTENNTEHIENTENTNQISAENTEFTFSVIGGDYQFPDESASDNCEGQSLFQGLLCIDTWPCDSFFCINVSTTQQKVGGNSAKATFVQELVDVGIEQLNYLKGHTLTVQKNSNERFIISVGKFFDRPIGLDVIIQGIPIKLVPTKTAFDKEPNVLQKLSLELCKRLGFRCNDNGNIVVKEAERTLNMAIEKNALQQNAWVAVSKNTEAFQKKYEEVKQAWKIAQTIKHEQSFWEEFRKHLNIMGLYFDSIESAFLQLETSGLDILSGVGQSCN